MWLLYIGDFESVMDLESSVSGCPAGDELLGNRRVISRVSSSTHYSVFTLVDG
jgi:hypothetical protein